MFSLALLKHSDSGSRAETLLLMTDQSGNELRFSFDGPSLVKKLKHIALMRLVPRNFHGRNGPQIESLYQVGFQQLLSEIWILCNRGHHQGGSYFFEHLALGYFDNAGVGT